MTPDERERIARGILLATVRALVTAWRDEDGVIGDLIDRVGLAFDAYQQVTHGDPV